MTEQIENKLKQIQEKLVLLAKQNASLIKENNSLKESLQDAKQLAEKAGKDAELIQHQLDARKYSQAMMSQEEKKAFEKKINGYIKEIDKCIALLSV